MCLLCTHFIRLGPASIFERRFFDHFLRLQSIWCLRCHQMLFIMLVWIYTCYYNKRKCFWNLILFYNFNSLLTCILLSKLSPIWPVGFLSSWPLCPLCEASIIFQGLPYFIPQEYLWGIVCTLSVSEFPVYIMPSLISKILKSHGPLPACLSYSLFFLTTPTPHPLEFHMHTSLSSKLPFLEELKH